jgi:PadR family transcriptional regulator
MHPPTPSAPSLRDLSKDYVAASAAPIILSILERGDSYGYAIGQRVSELSAGEMAWADGMLYPILHRLERRGWIEAYWGTAESGRKRRYYRLRPAGRDELAVLRAHWHRIDDLLETLEGESDVRSRS